MSQSATFHLHSLLLGILLGLFLSGGALFVARRPQPPAIALHPPPTPNPTPLPSPTPTPAPITIFVSGAVGQPGLYTLPPTSRAGDAIAAAGGMGLDADPALVNQAQPLWDGAQVHVPSLQPEHPGPAPPVGVSGLTAARPGTGSDSSGQRINVNTASAHELESLPGVGPSRAQAIIDNRPYTSLDDLTRVPGIGAKTLESLADLIRVD